MNWNTCELTLNCLRSIIESVKGINYEVIMVDNGSTDGSAGVIKQNFPQIIVIENERNLGFAEANNQALAISQGNYFLLLNSDTILQGNVINNMVVFLNSHSDAGAVTCKLLNSDGSIQYNMHRRFPSFTRLFFGFLYHHYPKLKTRWATDYLMLDDKFDRIEKIEQAAGACIMLRKICIEEMGYLFDAERFPIYYNDVDLCYRINRNNYSVYLIPDMITHLKGQSIKRIANYDDMKERFLSILRYFRKHKRYADYLLSKTFSLTLFSFIVLYSVILLITRKLDLVSFKNHLSIPLSILFEKRIDFRK